eukprot:10047.XXX_505659_505784_1 [CDS] Oithona nana genome sequencing.
MSFKMRILSQSLEGPKNPNCEARGGPPFIFPLYNSSFCFLF